MLDNQKLASMSKEELKAYCNELEKELSEAQWFLRQRMISNAKEGTCTENH